MTANVPIYIFLTIIIIIYVLGYSNEVGESFRAIVHVNVVRASYLVAFGYVFADTFDKVKKTNKVLKHFFLQCEYKI